MVGYLINENIQRVVQYKHVWWQKDRLPFFKFFDFFLHVVLLYSDLLKEFKKGIRSLFDPSVDAMGRRPYLMSRHELLYLRIWCNYSARSAHIIVTHELPLDNLLACMI